MARWRIFYSASGPSAITAGSCFRQITQIMMSEWSLNGINAKGPRKSIVYLNLEFTANEENREI